MKQSIEEVAYDYATQKTKFRKEVLKEIDADNYVSRHSDCMEDFQCGYNCRKEESPWISVKERFPEEQQHVLFISEWRGIHRAYYTGQYRKGKWETEEHIFNTTSFYGTITHWMLIPKFDQ